MNHLRDIQAQLLLRRQAEMPAVQWMILSNTRTVRYIYLITEGFGGSAMEFHSVIVYALVHRIPVTDQRRDPSFLAWHELHASRLHH